MKFRRTSQQIIHGAFGWHRDRELPFDQLAPTLGDQGGPFLLQLLDCLRECRLADPKRLRWPRGPTVRGDRDDLLEHPEVHAADPLIEVIEV